MKKKTALAALVLALSMLAACSADVEPTAQPVESEAPVESAATVESADPVESTAPESAEPVESEAPVESDQPAELLLAADFATDEQLAQVAEENVAISPMAAESPEYVSHIYFKSNETLQKLEFVDGMVEFDDQDEFYFVVSGEPYYSVENFTTEDECLLNMVFVGTFPTTAVIVTAEDGTQYCYTITTSGEDGSLILMEMLLGDTE